MADTSAPLIELDHVSCAIEGREILSDISLRTNMRRIGIVGRNGSGKTTLARLIAGLVPAGSGQVRIEGVDVARDRKGALGAVGILFQNPDHQIIFPTVAEELGFGLRQMGQPADAVAQGVEAVLTRFGKSHWAGAAVHQLSQGQRQLVCLMSILAMAPKVIVLDEPFSGLDIPTAAQLARVLEGLKVTLVQITHDPGALAEYDLAVWIDQGRMVQHGAPDVVLDAFRQRMEQIGEGDDLSDLAS